MPKFDFLLKLKLQTKSMIIHNFIGDLEHKENAGTSITKYEILDLLNFKNSLNEVS